MRQRSDLLEMGGKKASDIMETDEIMRGLELTDDEIMAIFWHMSAWDLPFQSAEHNKCISAAKTRCPPLVVVQCADELASGILENE